MVLTLAAGPRQGLEAVAQALDSVTGASAPRRSGGGHTAPPVPVFVLASEALDEARPLAQAAHVGWRYVARRSGVTAAVDLRIAEAGELRFHRLRKGRAAGALLRAARQAEADHADGESLEVRILSLPPLHLEALWLAGERTNLFLPLDRRRKAFPLLEEARRRLEQRRRAMASESDTEALAG